MQFKYPELLYALLLLVIPIIIHLFQLRRFKQVPFTNVAFLKKVTMQTRKSSQLKKWLTLLTRLLLLACIVLAFAQPFTSKSDVFNRERETVIYLDNSFSMQAKGTKGELLKRALQDLIINVPEDEELTLFTNTESFNNTTLKAIKNDVLQIPYASRQLDYEALQIKARNSFKNKTGSLKNVILISDFQRNSSQFQITNDSNYTTHLIQLKPVTPSNIFIDSTYISKTDVNTILLNVKIKNTGESVSNLPISLFDGEKLMAKTSITIDKEGSTQFSLPVNKPIDGKITAEDGQLLFDNDLFFNINASEKIKVLSISNTNDAFLKRIFTKDEFDFKSSQLSRLNYSEIAVQNVVVLNELNSIPNSLITAVHSFTNAGGYIIIIPSSNIDLNTYNQLFRKYNLGIFGPLSKQEKRITSINYSHPLYSGVFDKKINNFQYPKVNTFYEINASSGSAVLQFEDGKSFLQKNNNAYIFTSAINSTNSNFKSSPLIVPTLYNIAKQSLSLPNLYYGIGVNNRFDVNTSVSQDNILKLIKGSTTIIPQQQPFASKVNVTTDETPSEAGIYNIINGNEIVKKVSYNYSREESHLQYYDLKDIKSGLVSDSIQELFDELKSDTKINELWKWFVIFALLFLIIEMLILKYIK